MATKSDIYRKIKVYYILGHTDNPEINEIISISQGIFANISYKDGLYTRNDITIVEILKDGTIIVDYNEIWKKYFQFNFDDDEVLEDIILFMFNKIHNIKCSGLVCFLP